MRPIFKGNLSFGLVNIPVSLYSATEEKNISFHQLHKKDLSPIRYARICKEEGQEIPYSDIVRGFEFSKGQFVPITDKELESANIDRTKTIEITDFVYFTEIDPMLFEKPYYLEPLDESFFKPYRLLLETMQIENKAGIAKYVLRNKEHLGAVIAKRNIRILEQLRFKNQVRANFELKIPQKINLTKKEIDLASSLIKSLSSKFNTEVYKDTYNEELQKIIKAKVSGQRIKSKGKVKEPTPPNDLIKSLIKSIEKSKK
jgi:DNA end-binding protein Ku